MMEIYRTTDVELIRSIVAKGDVTEGEIVVPIHDSIYYLVAMGIPPMGVICFMPMNTITWNPHIVVAPEYRGIGTEFMKLGIQWMFDNTSCQKMVAYPPEYNKTMIRVFEKCSFNHEGYSPKSFMFRGVVYDRFMMGLEK